ncbi:MAG TPA: hypothetical protein VFW96_25300, partial [Thermomicrobiales bacterium]|nr:hypothetical protein [Thermomicrobiales bacterium]
MSGLPPLPASDLLIADRPLLVMPRLVALVGLNEAIVLQQVRYWLGDDLRPQVRDGRRWVYNSYRAWQERNFPFWQVDTVKRAFLSLERQGLLRSANYNRNRRNHTKWYTVDFDRLRELDRLYRAAAGAPPAPRTSQPIPAPAGLPPLPATDLLLDEHPLLILPRLAALVGFDEALILQQVRYWLSDARRPQVRDGRRWARFTREEWHEQFPFRSVATLARAFRRLERLGLLIACDRYNHEPGDRTKWYTIDFDRVAALEAAGQGVRQEPREAEDTPDAQSAPHQEINLPRPAPQDAPAEPGDLPRPVDQPAPFQARSVLRPAPQDAPASGAARPDQRDDLPKSGTETLPETPTETEPEKQQPALMPTPPGAVVVVDPPEVLIARLTERG